MIELVTTWILKAFLSFVPKMHPPEMGTAKIGAKLGLFLRPPHDQNSLSLYNFSKILLGSRLTATMKPTAYCVFRDSPEKRPPLFLPDEVLSLPGKFLLLPEEFLVLPEEF